MSETRTLPMVQNPVVAVVERIFHKLLQPFQLIFIVMQISSIVVFARFPQHSDLSDGLYAQLQAVKMPSAPSGLTWAPITTPLRLRPNPGVGEQFYFDNALFLFLRLGLSMVFL